MQRPRSEVVFFDLDGLLGVSPSDPEVERCVWAYRERYAEVSLRDTSAYPGVVAAVDAVGEGRRLAVATSKPRRFAERAVGVLWGFGTEDELREARADVLVREPAELVDAV